MSSGERKKRGDDSALGPGSRRASLWGHLVSHIPHCVSAWPSLIQLYAKGGLSLAA